MRNQKYVVPAALLIIGLSGIGRFSGDVRNVDVLGLFASGFVTGIALLAMIFIMRPNLAARFTNQ
jgi:hypothetical protein